MSATKTHVCKEKEDDDIEIYFNGKGWLLVKSYPNEPIPVNYCPFCGKEL